MSDSLQRSRFAGYVVVALISAVIGVVATTVAQRRVAPAHTDTAPHAAATTGSVIPDDEGGDHVAAAVYISPARQQLIGVRTEEIQTRTLETSIRTVGTLAYDETRIAEVHPKISGWVERVFVDFVGKPVRTGQALLTIYSPDLLATQNEYLLALKAHHQLGASAFEETRAGAESLVAATRDRLRLWDITDAQIADLERTGEAQRTMTLYSPFDGIVLERNTYAGQYITPEMSTAKIADISHIWAIAQLHEYEAQAIGVGTPAHIEFPYAQTTRHLTGRVTFVYPDINPDTRRARVRIEFVNPGLALKPESYVTVTLQRATGTRLAIPKEAVLDDGSRRYALVAHGDGYFEPREIEVGDPVDAFYPIVRGLAAGDRVVTSAQFLVDSESNLQAALQAMSASMPGMDMSGSGGDSHESAPAGPADHSGHGR